MRLPTQLRHRKPDSHKGDYGHILIIAGSLRYSGAALLCAKAAMAAGAGMVTAAMPRSVCMAILKTKPDELMLLPVAETPDSFVRKSAYGRIFAFSNKVDVIAIGPGLSTNISTQALVRKIVKTIRKPMVVDADALNAVAGRIDTKFPAGTVVTPHPGEMARLTGIPVHVIQKRRKEVAKNYARRYNITVVLKGNHTVVAAADGRVFINRTGNPGMATAGTGDVLTGIIAAFLGQGIEAFEAAKFGVYLHGLAGDMAARKKRN